MPARSAAPLNVLGTPLRPEKHEGEDTYGARGAANPAADLDGDPDVATELRSTIECVTTDCLTPAIADLEAAALYRPAGEARGGEPAGES